MNLTYKEVLDGELLMLFKEQNEEAEKILYLKYYYLIPCVIKKYFYTLKSLKIEFEDVYCECLSCLLYLFNNYDETKGATLKTYLNFCLERKVKYIIRQQIKNKKYLLSFCSLDDEIFEDTLLIDIIKDKNNTDPINHLISKEDFYRLTKNILPKLSKREKKIFIYLLKDMTLNEISTKLNISLKNLNNYLYRIKNKVLKMLKNEENG